MRVIQRLASALARGSLHASVLTASAADWLVRTTLAGRFPQLQQGLSPVDYLAAAAACPGTPTVRENRGPPKKANETDARLDPKDMQAAG